MHSKFNSIEWVGEVSWFQALAYAQMPENQFLGEYLGERDES